MTAYSVTGTVEASNPHLAMLALSVDLIKSAAHTKYNLDDLPTNVDVTIEENDDSQG